MFYNLCEVGSFLTIDRNAVMVLFKYVVFVALLSCCYSEKVRIGQGSKRDRTLQTILDILTAQDEKINRLHTMAVMNQFLPKCTAALKSKNLVAGSKCWKDMTTQIKTFDQSDTTEIKVLSQLITDSYDGEQTRLLLIAKFIENNVEKRSEIAHGGYKALLNAIDSFGHLYLKEVPTDSGYGSGFEDYTYRTLMQIKHAEGEASPVFTQMLPDVVKSILSEKEVFIRNNVTRDFMYAPPSNSNGSVTKILVNGGNGDDPRYIWKLKPVEYRWTKYNQESFYIENTFENKILAVADGDGSLQLADATEEQYKSTWSMFYIGLIQGSSGEEVAILCSYWGIKTLGLDEKEAWKIPKLLKSNTLEDTPTSIWLLQPKV